MWPNEVFAKWFSVVSWQLQTFFVKCLNYDQLLAILIEFINLHQHNWTLNTAKSQLFLILLKNTQKKYTKIITPHYFLLSIKVLQSMLGTLYYFTRVSCFLLSTSKKLNKINHQKNKYKTYSHSASGKLASMCSAQQHTGVKWKYDLNKIVSFNLCFWESCLLFFNPNWIKLWFPIRTIHKYMCTKF